MVAPGLLLLGGLILIGGRVTLAGGSVEQAAAAAARQASLARDPVTAARLARDTASWTLAAQHLQCVRVTVAVDSSGFRVPVGQPATVTVQVSCRLRLADIGLPGVADKTVTAWAASPLDPFRGRSPRP